MKERLLELDAAGNLLLGALLLAVPGAVSAALGVSPAEDRFYTVILGAVFVGIGLALFLERLRPGSGGLGLGGAAAINLTFAAFLVGWLAVNASPSRGAALLGALAAILAGIGMAELIQLKQKRGRGTQ